MSDDEYEKMLSMALVRIKRRSGINIKINKINNIIDGSINRGYIHHFYVDSIPCTKQIIVIYYGEPKEDAGFEIC
jgi:hypothetical protein